MKTNRIEDIGRCSCPLDLRKIATFGVCLIQIAALSLLLAGGLSGQQGTGSIAGTVTDSTGAEIADAAVTVTNAGTGFIRTVATDQSGLYTVPSLTPGTYSISVSHEGFTTKVTSGIVLQVAQRAGVDVSLDIGAVTQKIEVSGSAPLLETQSAAVGDVVETQRIEEMPLNGRQFLQLALLSADVVPSAGGNSIGGGTQGPTLNINGGRQDLNHFVIDGVNATNSQSNSLAIAPTVDAIQEFKVETSLGAIDTGGSGTSTVNVVLKQGTNSYHGDAFEFLRNDKLDAHNYFDFPGTAVPPYKQNQFGGTFGGPVIHNNTFFFVSYEGLRIRQTQTFLFSVPQAAFRNGDFSLCAANPALCSVPIDPTTGHPFPNNIIPQTRINSASQILQKLYPLPNVGNSTLLAGNYLNESAAPTTSDNFTIRIDHRFNDKNTLFGHFMYLERSDLNPSEAQSAGVGFYSSAVGGLPGFGNTAQTTDRNFGIGYTRVFTPNLILQVTGGWNRPGAFNTEYDPGNLTQAWGSILGIQGIPQGPTAFGPPAVSVSGFNSIGGGAAGGNVAEDRELQANATYTHGNHVFQFGTIQGWHLENLIDFNINTEASFQFSGNNTGNAYADFLLGVPFSASTEAGSAATYYFRAYEYGFYFADTWHITPRLVFEYGLRNDYQSSWKELNGRQATENLNPAEIVVPGTGSNIQGLAYLDPVYLPQIEKVVPVVTTQAAGYPRALINNDHKNFEPRIGFSWTPFADQKTVVRGGFGIYTGFKPFWEITAPETFAPFKDIIAVSNSTLKLPVQTVLSGAAGGFFPLVPPVAKNFPDAYSENWDLSIQHSITPNLVIDATYTGSATFHLENANYFNTPTTLGNLATAPYPQFSTGSVLINGNATANYNAGTLKLEKRFSHGVVATASFTESKALGTGTIPEQTVNTSLAQTSNRALEYSPTIFDVAHRFVASYVWELPFGTGRAFLSNGIVGKLLDWDFSGITTIQSGQPFTINLENNECGNFIPAACRPDQLVKNPNFSHGQGTVNEWFNTAAFAIQKTVRYGTAGFDGVRAPGITNFDMSLAKNMPIRENITLRFQFDAFDTFNNPHFGIPQRFADSPGFGEIFSAAAPRLLQAALKLSF